MPVQSTPKCLQTYTISQTLVAACTCAARGADQRHRLLLGLSGQGWPSHYCIITGTGAQLLAACGALLCARTCVMSVPFIFVFSRAHHHESPRGNNSPGHIQGPS